MSNSQATIRLPFVWGSRDTDEQVARTSTVTLPRDETALQTARNDQRWLESIIQDAAPFSDWWLKTRIIQLSYQPPDEASAAKQYVYDKGAIRLESALPDHAPGNTFPVYASKESCETILAQVEQELIAHGGQLGLSPVECRQRYRYLLTEINRDDNQYVYEVLDYWLSRRFTEAISRNFEVFVDADSDTPHVFLVVSTAPISLNTARVLPSSPALKLAYRYRPLFNVNEMAEILHQQSVETMTLRVHGYSNASKVFYTNFSNEARVMYQEGVIHGKHAYVGYHWPSEMPFLSPGLTEDVTRNLGIFMKFLLTLFVLSFIFCVLLSLLLAILPFFPWSFATVQDAGFGFLPTIFLPTLSIVFPLWFVAFTLLRLVVYQRDRYRAVHYGAPDLAECFWRLDKRLKFLMTKGQPITDQAGDGRPTKTVNLVGHSMGGLVLVNTLRVLSDRYGKDEKQADHRLGECFALGNLVLASPDIPLELIREGRNNYVRSAMRRCQNIYLFSSDRDTVLRYLSTLGNWFSEPSLQMSGLRLGNVYLQRKNGGVASELGHVSIRSLLRSTEAIAPTSAYDLFERFNYLDCSRMEGTNGIGLGVNPLTALVIDGLNTVMLLFGKVDVHGGYFRVHTPAFKLIQMIIKNPYLSSAEIRNAVDNSRGQIIFLPADNYMTREMGTQPR